MARTPRTDLLLLALVALACWGVSQGRALLPTTAWHVEVEIAQVRVSLGSAGAPVRNRTLLFEIGQVLIAWGQPR